MTVRLAPIVNDTIFSTTTGLIANGMKLFFYAAGTSTKQNTYTTSAGSVANSNPITLSSYGKSATQIWFTEGQTYKIVLAPSTDTDPPSSGVTLADNVSGINDTTILQTADQWLVYSGTPTYISATSFSLTGDQTSTFHVGRRIKTINTGGTVYSTITASVFGAVTTITVVNDSGSLDSGISSVYYAFLTSVNPSIPKIALPDGSTAPTQTSTDSSTKIATTAFAKGLIQNRRNDFRLTLTSGVPVTVSDVTGATTIYCTPFQGNGIALYNGSTWEMYTSAEFSVALGTITSDQGYDVFCYANGSTPTLEILAWTNNTTRATALAYQDGVLSKSGATTRRYMGSFLTTSTTTTEDSDAKRYFWNYYYQVEKSMRAVDATASWTYTLATWRQANASSTNQLNFFIGAADRKIRCFVSGNFSNAVSANVEVSVGFGLNSTTAPTGLTATGTNDASNANKHDVSTFDSLLPVLGKNYIAKLEISAATGTTTWRGTTGNTTTGINGSVFC